MVRISQPWRATDFLRLGATVWSRLSRRSMASQASARLRKKPSRKLSRCCASSSGVRLRMGLKRSRRDDWMRSGDRLACGAGRAGLGMETSWEIIDYGLGKDRPHGSAELAERPGPLPQEREMG